MKRIQLIKTIATTIIASFVVFASINAQRGGGFSGGRSTEAPRSNNSAPVSRPSYNPNNNVVHSPAVSAPTVTPNRGNNTVTNGNITHPSNPIYNSPRGNNTVSGNNNFQRPTSPTNGYNGNLGGGAGRQYHGNNYNHGYNNYNHGGNVYSNNRYYGGGYGRGYEGYGYRGYSLDIFSPYAVYPFYPTLGLRLGWLPFGYYSFNYDGYPYYYYNSVFYRRTDDNNYEIVSPPLGAKVTSIPNSSKTVVVNGSKYYESNGTYYQEEADSNNNVVYLVVGTNGELNQPKTPQVVYEPQVGDIVPQLPSNCSKVFLNGQQYFESPDNVYYQEVTDGDKTAYKIVGK